MDFNLLTIYFEAMRKTFSSLSRCFIENKLILDGYHIIAGVDEVGRGAWAGPVVASAVILDRSKLDINVAKKINDSKKLSVNQRQDIFLSLIDCAEISIASSSAAEIDASNILKATLLAMRRAIEGLRAKPDIVLIDGTQKPKIDAPAECIKKGDQKCISIAAASIAAKVTRDKIMCDLTNNYIGYGWERNAGYGTLQHKSSILKLGITPEHRQSFKPMRHILGVG